ncbi:hypothetical protein [Kibdelosporangium philippinense]
MAVGIRHELVVIVLASQRQPAVPRTAADASAYKRGTDRALGARRM